MSFGIVINTESGDQYIWSFDGEPTHHYLVNFLKDELGEEFEYISDYKYHSTYNINFDLEKIIFTEKDIRDKELLEHMIEKEAHAIYSSENTRKGRDLDTVKFCVRQGKIAELWLIENQDYLAADKKYHDLMKITKKGIKEYTEVKAYNVTDKNAPGVQKDLKRLRTEKWNTSKWYVLFKCQYGEYEFLEKIKI